MVLKVAKGDKAEIRRMVAKGHDVLLDYIINYINRQHETGDQTPGFTDLGSSKFKFLLIVDNVEDLIEHSAIDFKNLISKFLNECEDLSLVLTSRRSLGTLYDSVQG